MESIISSRQDVELHVKSSSMSDVYVVAAPSLSFLLSIPLQIDCCFPLFVNFADLPEIYLQALEKLEGDSKIKHSQPKLSMTLRPFQDGYVTLFCIEKKMSFSQQTFSQSDLAHTFLARPALRQHDCQSPSEKNFHVVLGMIFSSRFPLGHQSAVWRITFLDWR